MSHFLFASARLKNARVDAATPAQLLRADLLPEAWIAPPTVRQLRAPQLDPLAGGTPTAAKSHSYSPAPTRRSTSQVTRAIHHANN